MNRLVTSFIGYLTKNKPKFYGIPFNEQYECKDFYLKTYDLPKFNFNKNKVNSVLIRKKNDNIIPYKEQYETRDF